MLIETPDAVRAVHARFLAAGADCIISATYQASFPGLARYGLSDRESERLFRFAVELAEEERTASGAIRRTGEGRRRPLVAASVGPYGAFLADGSEYTGDYRADDAALATFHWRRLELLARSGADLLAVETIPSAREGRVLRRLLDQLDDPPPAWISFTCRDGGRLSDGTPVEEAAGGPRRLRPDPLGRRQLHAAETPRRADPEVPGGDRKTRRRLPERRRPLGRGAEGVGRCRRRRRTCRSWPSNGAGSGPNSSAAAAGPVPRTSGRCAAP